jgi:hypothetical protein
LYPVANLTLAELLVSIHMDNGRNSHGNIQQDQGPWKGKISGLSVCPVSALRYIREQGIKHMDVKPQNILIKCSSALASSHHLEVFAILASHTSLSLSLSMQVKQTHSSVEPRDILHPKLLLTIVTAGPPMYFPWDVCLLR